LKALAEALGLSIDGGNLEIKMRIAQNLGLDHGTIMDFLVCKTPKKGVVRNKKSAAKKSAVKKDDVETD
jgi:hypothetical protein